MGGSARPAVALRTERAKDDAWARGKGYGIILQTESIQT